MKTELSIVSPVYNAEKILPELLLRINDSLTKITDNYEVILVDDGSSDNSWQVVKVLANSDARVKGIKLSRNFGQHYAISAGLDNTNGEWIVVMDCDLQDRPEEICNLYKKAIEGYDYVLAKRGNRKDNLIKKLLSALFYRTLGYLTGSEQDETVANFGIYSRKVINAISNMKESIRYFPTMIKWVGFRSAKISVIHGGRISGRSGYSFRKLFKLGLDIILAYSDKPIRLLIKIGLLVSIAAFLVAVYTFIIWIQGQIKVPGYTSLILSVWFLSGVIISTLGFIGLYVGKIFEGVKNRPIYIVEDTVNDNSC